VEGGKLHGVKAKGRKMNGIGWELERENESERKPWNDGKLKSKEGGPEIPDFLVCLTFGIMLHIMYVISIFDYSVYKDKLLY
jgi:hypothetical protein